MDPLEYAIDTLDTFLQILIIYFANNLNKQYNIIYMASMSIHGEKYWFMV